MKLKVPIGLTILLIFILHSVSFAQNPAEKWEMYVRPEEAGFSSRKLAEARSLYETLDAAALLVIYDGKVLASWGDVYRRFMCHSVRKSFLSALYGIHVDEGTIDLDKTLADLKIDDVSPLTEIEKRATVRDLLKARSGVYHPAAYETPGMKALRPPRGSREPGTFWYYNNWDFNTLGTILEQETGTDIFVDFKNRIADPLQMEDYRVMDGYHHLEPQHSIHPAYPFRMSARDMARFGLLYLRQGKWNGRQVIPEDWIRESSIPYSKTGNRGYMAGYGYLWWISDDLKDLGLYSALGVGTQIISVLPGANMVIVQRVNTYESKQVAPNMELFRKIIEAQVSLPKKNPEITLMKEKPEYPVIIRMAREELDKYTGEYPVGVFIGDSLLSGNNVKVVLKEGELVLESPFLGNYKLLPLSPTMFFAEDLERYGAFEFEHRGYPHELTLFPTEKVADFYSSLLANRDEKALVQLQNTIRERTDKCYFNESELIVLGLQLSIKNRVDEAIDIWKFGLDVYPQSSKLHEYLGETFRINGNIEQAVQHYKKALELDPQNTNAKRMLKELERNKKSVSQRQFFISSINDGTFMN